MNPIVLATPRLPPDAVALLRQEFTIVPLPADGALTVSDGVDARDARGIATPGAKPGCAVDASLFERLPGLEIIASFSSGLDGIDAPGALARGIVVTHAPGVMAEPAADIALALVLDQLRGVSRGIDYVRAGRWRRDGQMPLAAALRGRTAGIVGLGRIGRAVAARLAVCGMRVLYHGRTARPAAPYEYVADLAAMASMSSVLVLCCPATPATEKLIDARILTALGPEGILVNVSRGSVVDDAALIAALRERRIAGAGLDVARGEPDPDPAFIGLDNVTLLPHLGAATRETREQTFATLAENLRCHFAGRPVPDAFVPG